MCEEFGSPQVLVSLVVVFLSTLACPARSVALGVVWRGGAGCCSSRSFGVEEHRAAVPFEALRIDIISWGNERCRKKLSVFSRVITPRTKHAIKRMNNYTECSLFCLLQVMYSSAKVMEPSRCVENGRCGMMLKFFVVRQYTCSRATLSKRLPRLQSSITFLVVFTSRKHLDVLRLAALKLLRAPQTLIFPLSGLNISRLAPPRAIIFP